MSLTVINAAMLAALTCEQLRKEHKASGNSMINLTLKSKDNLCPLPPKKVDEHVATDKGKVDGTSFFQSVLIPFQKMVVVVQSPGFQCRRNVILKNSSFPTFCSPFFSSQLP